VANGLRTDHPIPDLPFVDDAHIPVDNPQGIQAVGRHPGGETWGRQDRVREGGWVAFTTDPRRHDLSWCVRWHPDHGRSVILYRGADASPVHMAFWGPALLFRAGGYWWDGTSWYRPAQVWDPAGEVYVRRVVPAATIVSAADLLADGDLDRGQVLAIEDVTVDAGRTGTWAHDLALWAARRPGDARPLAECVVRVAAPELTGDQLVSQAELAEIAGIAPSTLRAYAARGEAEIPLPQAAVGGRSVWSRPVAEDWAECRRRSSEGIEETMKATRNGASQPPGIIDVWNRYARMFMSALWDNPNRRRRWALRWRTEPAVRDLAENLGWYVAADLTGEGLIPLGDLATTITHAILDEFVAGKELDANGIHIAKREATFYGIMPPIAHMLDWLIRHRPTLAASTIANVIGDAERRLDIPRDVSEESIRTALTLDGALDDDDYQTFLDRVLTPTGS
jgi:hypothetical protein